MKVLALVSGGKDSVYNMMRCVAHGHEIVALGHMCPPDSVDELDSFTFQTVGSRMVYGLAECMGLPLVVRTITGKSVDQGMHYYDGQSGTEGNDEVEDLYGLLRAVKEQHPEVEAVSTGAVLSSYQRHRVEDVCGRAGLKSLAYMWQRPQGELLDEMLASNLEAVVVKVAAMGLDARHVGKTIRQLAPLFERLEAKFGFHVCGEGGEYETIALDCPLFAKRMVIDESRVVAHDQTGEVCYLVVDRFHVEDKTDGTVIQDEEILLRAAGAAAPASEESSGAGGADGAGGTEDGGKDAETKAPAKTPGDGGVLAAAAGGSASPSVPAWPASCSVGRSGHVYISGLVGPSHPSPASSAASSAAAALVSGSAEQAAQIKVDMAIVMDQLRAALAAAGCTLADVCYVHLLIGDMRCFGAGNSVYCTYFGRCPGSRSCVQADLPGGALVALDCVALRRSGEAMARNDGLLRLRPAGEDGATTAADAAAASPTSAASLRRQVLHVQSISEWAPVCIGPYSQANVLNGLVLVAGQIALVPASMAMVTPASAAGLDIVVPPEAAIDDQLYVETVLSLRHCERILRCLQSRLAAVLAGVVYVSRDTVSRLAAGGHLGGDEDKALALLWRFCADQWDRAAHTKRQLGGGKDDAKDDDDDDEDDDEDDDDDDKEEEMSAAAMLGAPSPLLCVVVPYLPRGASIEFETIAAEDRRLAAAATATAVATYSSKHGDDDAPASPMTWYRSQTCGTLAHHSVALFGAPPSSGDATAAAAAATAAAAGTRVSVEEWAAQCAKAWLARTTAGLVAASSSGSSAFAAEAAAPSIRIFHAAGGADDGTDQVQAFAAALRDATQAAAGAEDSNAVEGAVARAAISYQPVDRVSAFASGTDSSDADKYSEVDLTGSSVLGLLFTLAAVDSDDKEE